MPRRDGVMTSVGEDATSERGNGGDDPSWSDVNLTGPKMRKFTRLIQLVQIDNKDLNESYGRFS
jgi:hypothetical protein